MDAKRLGHLIAAAAGMWLIWSARIVGFEDESAPVWNSLACGALLMLSAAGLPKIGFKREQWLMAAVGGWLALFACAFPSSGAARSSELVAGLGVLAVAAWTIHQSAESAREYSAKQTGLSLASVLYKRLPH